MKNRLFFITVSVMICVSSMSQTSKPTNGFSEFKINYNLSFISQDPFTTTIGIGIGSNFTFNEKLSLDAELIIKPTKKDIEDFDFIGDWVYYEVHTHQELSAFYMDFPIHINYKLYKLKSFTIFISSGPRLFYLNTTHELLRTTNNTDPVYYNVKRNNVNVGLDFGFVQKLELSENVGLFASQHYGKSFLGYSKGFESTDLNFGFTYKIK